MTNVVLDLDDPAMTAQAIRLLSKTVGNAVTSAHLDWLADAIEAAADKRVIVLDVDELPDSDALRSAATDTASWASAEVVLVQIADALDSLPPPRPPEPTGFGAQIRDGKGNVWLRIRSDNAAGTRFWVLDDVTTPDEYDGILGPIEILSEGVS